MSTSDEREAAPGLRARVEADLKASLRARDRAVVATLRSLLAAFDNAGAVPLTAEHVPVYGRANEVARRALSDDDLRAIVAREADELRAAVAEYAAHGRAEAEGLRAGLAVLGRYLPG